MASLSVEYDAGTHGIAAVGGRLAGVVGRRHPAQAVAKLTGSRDVDQTSTVSKAGSVALGTQYTW